MRPIRPLVLALAVLATVPAVQAQTPQYTAFAGVLHKSEPDTGAVARAKAAVAADPRSVEKLMTLGLAQTAVRQVREAITTFTAAIEISPANAMLYRHRGHRYVSIAEFDRAIEDLEQGAKLDPKNYFIWYHLGVARFAKREFDLAAQAFARGQPMAPTVNEFIGSTDWLWMSLARAGRAAEAERAARAIPDSITIPTNYAYGKRLRLYRGEVLPDSLMGAADTANVQISTLAFGVGNWYLVKQDTLRAKAWLQRSVAARGWPAFAYLIAERELARLR